MAFDVFAAFPTGTVEFPEPAFQFVDALVHPARYQTVIPVCNPFLTVLVTVCFNPA